MYMKLRISSACLACSLLLLLAPGCSSSSGSTSNGELEGTAGLTEDDLNFAREQRFGDADIPLAEGDGFFRDVHFSYDSSNLSDIARQNIEYNVQLLQQNPKVKVQLEGHCDERGTNEYNMALGKYRAQSVKDMLIAYGIEPGRLSTISYGEELPVDQGRSEQSFSQNRRVHFSGFTR